MSSPALPTTSVDANAALTETQVITLRQQFVDLSTDYYILHGEFGKEDQLKQFASQNISWYDFEKRCANLRSEVQNFRQNPATPLPQIATDYNSLVADFKAIRAQLTGLRVSLEGPNGHTYAARNARFQIIGNQQGLPASPLAVRKSKKRARRQGTTVSKPVAKMERKPSLPFATSVKKRNQSVVKDDTYSKSSVAPAVQPSIPCLERSSLTPFKTALSTTTLHPPDVSSLQEQVLHLETTNASMKASLQNLNKSNGELRKAIQDKEIENGRNEVEMLKVRGTIRDYRDFVDELAAALDRHDPSFLQERGELKGNKVIIKLQNGTKLWVDRSNRRFEIRDVEAEQDDMERLERMRRLPVMAAKRKIDFEAETDDEDADGDFEP